MKASQLVESYKFWDVVTLYARERLEHDTIVARALVGYSAKGDAPVLLRADALEHLLGVVRAALEPQRTALDQEFIKREDFARWLTEIKQPLPLFWFDA